MLTVKSLIYLLGVALFGINIYQISFYFSTAYSEETELKSLKQLGVKGSWEGQFTFPHSLAVDKLGNIYVGDTGNKRVQKFSSNGTFLTSWGSDGNGTQQLHKPEDIAVNSNGKDIYITDTRNSRIRILRIIN